MFNSNILNMLTIILAGLFTASTPQTSITPTYEGAQPLLFKGEANHFTESATGIELSRFSEGSTGTR